MHENYDLIQRKGKKVLPALKDKNLWEFEEESDKKGLDWIGRGGTIKKLQTKIQSVENKLRSIEEQIWSIQHQSSTNQARQIVTKIFITFLINWDSDLIDQKLENSNFLKTEHFNVETLKAHSFMNEMHEYEIKSFSKTLEFNPNIPKTSFSTNLSSKTQTLNKFCIRIKEFLILDGHNKFTHNIMY